MPTGIDKLMDKLPTLNAEYERVIDQDPTLHTPKDIDTIIAYHRRNRANAEAGIKPPKERGSKPSISLKGVLDNLMTGKPKATEPSIKRRI